MSLPRRLRHLFRRQRSESEMAEEMRFHLEQRAADYADRGLPDEEAAYAARRKFGNLGSIQEQAREAHGWGWLERLGKDFQFAWRQIAKSPGFATLAIVTLALGIGANTTMFSALNEILIRPLPYPENERLDRIDRATPQNPEGRLAPADFLELRAAADNYGEISGYELGDTSLAEPGRPADIVRGLRQTANFLSTLRMQVERGRDFQPQDELPGNDRVAIISRRCWQNRFGGRSDIIGHTVRIDGERHEIVGVLPLSFNDQRHLGHLDLFRPLAFDAEKAVDRRRANIRVIARRADRVSRAEGDAFVAAFGARLAAEHPEVNAGTTWRVVSLNRTIAQQNGRLMMPTLVGLTGFVLLIACSNLANLLLARTMARAREFAVRSALGASRLQLLRPLIAEALILALAGGVGAIIVSLWTADYLAMRSTDENGEHFIMVTDWRVLSWTFGASLLTALAFGLAPALFAMRLNFNHTLKSGGRGVTGDRGHQHFRHALIVGQVALAVILLTGAGLFIRSLDELNDRRAGWESDRVIRGTIVLPAATYPDAGRKNAFQRLALERLSALPGVASASISSFTPFFNWADIRKYIVQGKTTPKPGNEPAAVVNAVTARYFETVGTRIIAGRAFDERDTAMSPKVFVISQGMARALFGHENPIGRRLAQTGTGAAEWGEIVGVAANVTSALAVRSLVEHQLYQPMAQQPVARAEIAVRAIGATSPALIDAIRATMTTLDPDLPVQELQPANAAIRRYNYTLAVLRDILISIAVLGLGLASLGIYGVIARAMAERTNEFAIRLALGACVRDITRIVLASGVKLALIGSVLGVAGAIAVARLIASGFPGMQFHYPSVIVGTTAVLIIVALLACWLPARRAGKVDAIVALRAD